MTLFKTDEEAWSKLTKQFEARYGGDASPYIIQTNTVLRPLSCATKWPALNLFRRLIVADTIPSYSRANSSPYIAGGSRVSINFEQYLEQLNVSLRKYAPTIDPNEADLKLRLYRRADQAQKSFDDQARKDWTAAKKKDPLLIRSVWEQQYHYRDRRQPYLDKVDETYGDYLSLIAAYPPLRSVGRALRQFRDPLGFIRLPMNEDEADFGMNTPGGDQTWEEVHNSIIDFSIQDFMDHDAPDSVLVTEASSRSTSYETRWDAHVGGGGLFWNFGGSAEGGSVDRHFREDASRFALGFKRLGQFQVLRKNWYNETLVKTYGKEVEKDEYWGRSGALNLIPSVVILGARDNC